MSLNRKMCQTLIQKSIKLVNNFNTKAPLQQQIRKQGIFEAVQIPLDNLKNPSKLIGAHNIFAHPLLRITIYNLPKGVVMKLHDHPTMNVFSYIMQGSMTAHLFNPYQAYSSANLWKRETFTLEKDSFEIIEGMHNNLHEFVAEKNQCTFMDIIFPDYDEQNRLCTHFDYEKVDQTEEGSLLYSLRQKKGYFPPMIQI